MSTTTQSTLAELEALEAELADIRRKRRLLLRRIEAVPEDAVNFDHRLAVLLGHCQVLDAREREVQNRLLGADVLARLERLEVQE